MTDYAAFWDEKPLWVEVLLRRISVDGLRGVARTLGVSHSLVSKCLRHERSEDSLAQRVIEKWGQISCEAHGDEISFIECEARCQQACPTHNPMAMQRWKACQHCPNHPEQRGASSAGARDKTAGYSQARQEDVVCVSGSQGVGVRQ